VTRHDEDDDSWEGMGKSESRVYLILMENEFHERDFGIFRSRVETLLANERQAHAVCLHHGVLSLSVSRPLACANGEKNSKYTSQETQDGSHPRTVAGGEREEYIRTREEGPGRVATSWNTFTTVFWEEGCRVAQMPQGRLRSVHIVI